MAASAVLLAAGRSERMGSQKALLDWQGRPLLAYQIEQLAAVDGIDEIIVVTGFGAEHLRPIVGQTPTAREAHNDAFDAGKAGSVRTGMEAVSDRANSILLLAVDQPRPRSLLKLLHLEHERHSALISVPVFEGRRGHPVVFDRALLPELRNVDDASHGIRAVLARHTADVREIAVADPIVCLDLNTPEDIEQGRSMPW